jgi:hypothetical protein
MSNVTANVSMGELCHCDSYMRSASTLSVQWESCVTVISTWGVLYGLHVILFLQIPMIDMKLPFLSSLAVLIVLVILMYKSGCLTRIILQYPFLLITISGIIFYVIAHFLVSVFFNSSRLNSLVYFFGFMTLYITIMAGLFFYSAPVLQLSTDRVILRPGPNCSFFEDPPKYMCYYNETEKAYTTIKDCSITPPTNLIAFYIISTLIPSVHQYKLKDEFYFYPQNGTGPLVPFWLPANYCIQEFKPSLSTEDKLSVKFTSKHTETSKITFETGFVDKTDLAADETGWYRVSSCMLEVMRFLSFDCITGYISQSYVKV